VVWYATKYLHNNHFLFINGFYKTDFLTNTAIIILFHCRKFYQTNNFAVEKRYKVAKQLETPGPTSSLNKKVNPYITRR
jgi:hypothetical protein